MDDTNQEWHLALGFANTAAQRPGKETADVLTDYIDFTSWMEGAGALGSADAARLARRATDEPAAAAQALERATALRTATHSLFRALAAGRAVEPGDVDLLDREWREARSRLRLVRRGARFAARFPPGSTSLARPLWTLSTAAAGLLLSEELDRVDECDAPGCSHVFLDTSRNRSRRWCDMAICGNRMKARRHYRRHRAPS